MFEVRNGIYINRYAELDKPFLFKGVDEYKSKNGNVYRSAILEQDGAEFKFSVNDTELSAMEKFVGKEIFISCGYNAWGKYSFQQLIVNSFEPVPTK